MCGVGGIYRPHDRPLEGRHEAILARLKEAMRQRGPDGSGSYAVGPAGLVHTRLAIIDVHERSDQPMESEDWVLSYNGEIFNYRTLRAELSGRCRFQTESDTEVLLMALQEWGLEKALDKCAGMFAFLAFNKREQVLYAARDRMGIKPLFSALLDDGSLCFASSPAAIVKAVPDETWRPFRPALGSFFILGAPFTRTTAFDRIERVPPAHYLRCLPDGTVDTVKYWEPRYRPDFTMEDLVAVVREHQVADVPSALFLSGGVDSTFLASAMDDLDCFHLISPETRYAGEAARVFGRTLVSVTPELSDYERGMERVTDLHGEPLMSCGIPHAVARAVRDKGYKMAVSANGADELFHGYPRTPMPEHEPDYLPLHEQRTYKFFHRQLAHIFRNRDHFSVTGLDRFLPSLQEIGNEILAKLSLPAFPPSANHRWIELMTYVLFDLNPTLDAASMAEGVEVRVPFLDHRIVEGVLSWPAERLVTPKFGRKAPLKEHLAAHFPIPFLNRPKLGFSIHDDSLADIGALGRTALDRAVASGLVAPGEERCEEFDRDMIYLGGCCLALAKWRDRFDPEEALHA